MKRNQSLFFKAATTASDHIAYTSLSSVYTVAKKEHAVVVQQLSLLDALLSIFKSKGKERPVVFNTESIFPQAVSSDLFFEDSPQIEYCSFSRPISEGTFSVFSLLSDLKDSLYIKARRLYKKTKKLASVLRSFYSSNSFRSNFFKILDKIFIRIQSMRISDKSGEGDILSNINKWEEVLSNQINYHLNGKGTYSNYYT